MSESLAQAIETTTMDYKHIHLVDKLLEVCANLKITPALNDEEVDFVKKQYDAFRQKYEAVKKPEMKREITFPGCGDRSDKEDPYGDFIIFPKILKFMVCGKDGLDKTDVIFLTREKVKGNWFYQDLAPITHYIEKAFLVTYKTLFIIHADRPLDFFLKIFTKVISKNCLRKSGQKINYIALKKMDYPPKLTWGIIVVGLS